MKRIVYLLAVLSPLSLPAEACPDVGGTYRMGEKVALKLVQTGCARLAKSVGFVAADGATVTWVHEQDFLLDGTPLCNLQKRCETATARADAIAFAASFEGPVLTEQHGRCSQHSFAVTKNSAGDLVSTFQVHACKDGFTGNALKVFKAF